MAYTDLDLYGGSSDPLTTADGYSSTYLDFKESGGKAVPKTTTQDSYLVWDTAASGSARWEVELSDTMSDFGILVGVADGTDVTDNHILVRFNIGSSTPPAWVVPDYILVSKRASAQTTEIDPSNTASLLLTPAVSNQISLRHRRLAAADRIGVLMVNDGTDAQLFVFVNDIIRYHEKVSGVTVSGKMAFVAYGSSGTPSTISITKLRGSDMTPRFVSKDVSASDSKTGADITTNAWATLNKAIATVATNEVVLVGAGTYTEEIKVYNNSFGDPSYTPTARADSVFLSTMADNAVRIQSRVPIDMHDESQYLYFYGFEFKQSSQSNLQDVVNLVQGAKNCVFGGGKILDGNGMGFACFSNGTDYDGGHYFHDILIQGNGRKDGLTHQGYIGVRNVTVEYCHLDALSGVPGWGRTKGYGIQNFQSAAEDTAMDNNAMLYNLVHFCR